MAYLSPCLAPAAALILPLTLAGAPALAQTNVKEDSVVLQPDKVADDAPVVETFAQAQLPSWTEDNARALLTFIQHVGEERSEEHTSELQSLMRISYAVFCLKKKNKRSHTNRKNNDTT